MFDKIRDALKNPEHVPAAAIGRHAGARPQPPQQDRNVRRRSSSRSRAPRPRRPHRSRGSLTCSRATSTIPGTCGSWPERRRGREDEHRRADGVPAAADGDLRRGDEVVRVHDRREHARRDYDHEKRSEPWPPTPSSRPAAPGRPGSPGPPSARTASKGRSRYSPAAAR